MRKLTLIAVVLVLVFVAGSGGAAPPKELEPVAFLVGQWGTVGTATGAPGGGTGSATFAWGLQDQVMIRTSYAEYPATASAPASRHDDLMVIYAAAAGGLRADYYDNEGHDIHYAVTTPAPGQASFVSDAVSGAPQFRLTYALGADGLLKGEFAIAPPDKPGTFSPYLTWESRKVAPRAKHGK